MDLVMVELMAEWKVDELALEWVEMTVVLTVMSSVERMAEGRALLKDDYLDIMRAVTKAA